jgi:hypothetical protein
MPTKTYSRKAQEAIMRQHADDELLRRSESICLNRLLYLEYFCIEMFYELDT